MSILLPGTLKISCRNWDESWLMTMRRSESSAISSMTITLVRIRLAKDRVQSGHDRHLQAAQQMQDVAAGRTAEDSILVLQADHVDIVEVQELSGFFIRSQVVLGERPSHPRRIVISLFRVVYRQRQQSSGSVLGGYGRAQVGGKRSNSTLSRQIVPDHRDPARQRWLRLRSRSGC